MVLYGMVNVDLYSAIITRVSNAMMLGSDATLPCETLMSAKQAINDKLQGRVAAYLRCGGVIICNQIKKGLLLSLRVKKINSRSSKVPTNPRWRTAAIKTS